MQHLKTVRGGSLALRICLCQYSLAQVMKEIRYYVWSKIERQDSCLAPKETTAIKYHLERPKS